MTERPTGIPPAELEPVETPKLPSERTIDDFAAEERVVVFAPMGGNKYSLKRGTIEPIDQNSKRVRVRLDHPPKVSQYHGTRPQSERGTYSVSVTQPSLMKEDDYERLHADRAAALEWVSSGYMDSQRQRDALYQKLIGIGIDESLDSAPLGAQLM